MQAIRRHFHDVSCGAVCPKCCCELFVGQGGDGAHTLGFRQHSFLKFGLWRGRSGLGDDVGIPLQNGNGQRGLNDAIDIENRMRSRCSISLEKLGNGFRLFRRFRAIKCSTSKNGFTEFAQRLRDIGFVGNEMRPTRSTHEIDVIERTGSCNKKVMVLEVYIDIQQTT